jgi:hypothetical protein
MWLLLAVLALSMMGAGGVMVWQGLDIILVERGWTFVISGSVLFAGGAVLLALSLVLRELRHIARDPLAVPEEAADRPQPAESFPATTAAADSEASRLPPLPPYPPVNPSMAIPPAGAGLAASAIAAGATAFAATRDASDKPDVNTHGDPRLSVTRDRVDGVPVLRDDPAFDDLTADFARFDDERAPVSDAPDRPTQLDADRARAWASPDEAFSDADGSARMEDSSRIEDPSRNEDSSRTEDFSRTEEPLRNDKWEPHASASSGNDAASVPPPVMRPAFEDLPPPPAPVPMASGGLSARLRSWLSPASKAAVATDAASPPPPVPAATTAPDVSAPDFSPPDSAGRTDTSADLAGGSSGSPDQTDTTGPDLAAFERELTDRLTRDLALHDDWLEPTPGDRADMSDQAPAEAPTLPMPDLETLNTVELQVARTGNDLDDAPDMAGNAPDTDRNEDTAASLATRDPFATAGRDWTREVPTLRPAMDDDPAEDNAAGNDTRKNDSREDDERKDDERRAADELPGFSFELPVVVRTYTAGENSYVIFSDGSIEAETPDGHFRFASIDEMKAFVAGGGKS